MKPYALRRIWNGPELGLLLALGMVGAIFFLTLVRIAVAICVDQMHCLKTKGSEEHE